MKIILLLLLPFLAGAARADVITEFGIGWKVPENNVVPLGSSALFHPDCSQVNFAVASNRAYTRENSPHWGKRTASCGGDNPIFIGWPVAFESNWRGPWRWRVGWFHLSHWGDGNPDSPIAQIFGEGDEHELTLDCLCATATFNWTRWSRRRK